MSMSVSTRTRAARKTEPQTWNPRYLAYAAAHGKTPAAMLDADAEQWPSAKMTGYTQWLCWAWQAWDSIHGNAAQHSRTEEEQASFTAWLVETLGVVQ